MSNFLTSVLCLVLLINYEITSNQRYWILTIFTCHCLLYYNIVKKLAKFCAILNFFFGGFYNETKI